jgi:phosphoserine phosphatase
MCYFTITSDKNDKEGRTQALMIIDIEDEEAAKREFVKTFKIYDFKVTEGIKLEDDFGDLVTPTAKKLITKHKSGNSDVSLVSYCNSIYTKHPEE